MSDVQDTRRDDWPLPEVLFLVHYGHGLPRVFDTARSAIYSVQTAQAMGQTSGIKPSIWRWETATGHLVRVQIVQEQARLVEVAS